MEGKFTLIKAPETARNSKTAYGIPNADEFDCDTLMNVHFVLLRESIGRMRLRRAIVSPCVRQRSKRLTLENAAGRDQSRKATGRERPARKAEQIDLIARHIVLRDELVRRSNIVVDAKTDCGLIEGVDLKAGGSNAAQIKN